MECVGVTMVFAPTLLGVSWHSYSPTPGVSLLRTYDEAEGEALGGASSKDKKAGGCVGGCVGGCGWKGEWGRGWGGWEGVHAPRDTRREVQGDAQAGASSMNRKAGA